jgi:DNA-binding winged helix-turn-helix (wHTH) protein
MGRHGGEVPWEFREMSGKFGGQLSMAEDRQVAFGSFRFAPRTGQLWRDGNEVRLTPRAAAVLQFLIERAQEIITKQDLFDRVWGGLAVTDDALTSCIGELSDLADDARRPAISRLAIGAASV